MWICPYKTELFPIYAEEEGGDTWRLISELARKYNVYIVAGTVPEKDAEGRIYNTCYAFNRQGEQIGKQRKVHLFDCYRNGVPLFRESDTLTPGNGFCVFDTEWCKMGLNVCFDIRFPESARFAALGGAKIIFNPSAFNMTTGPAHWEVAFKQRAIENQVYMVGTAPARNPEQGFTAYGHSIITDPWGGTVLELEDKPATAIGEINLDYVEKIRSKLPMLSARRTDLYELHLKC